MKRISILGSTGFIGRHTLEIIREFPERFHLTALSAWYNIDLLERQIAEFKPKVVSVADRDLAVKLKKRLSNNIPRVIYGIEGLKEVAAIDEADTAVSAIVGSSGLIPTLSAIKAGKDVALANKESLVMAGQIIMDEVKRRGTNLFPVDSEHSAIFQALQGHRKEDVKRLVLTASGGP
ncbi:MAG: 1-deoxy-D-xylulose-5-phosphate reductoisomerase, partial [Thermodesulfobacteriota bacterium]